MRNGFECNWFCPCCVLEVCHFIFPREDTEEYIYDANVSRYEMANGTGGFSQRTGP